MTGFFRASLETRNFSFEAYATSAEEARRLLLQAFAKHRDQYGIANGDWWKQFEDDIEVRELFLGAFYRDRELLTY